VNHREHGLRLPPVEARRALVGYVAELIDHACDCGQAMQAQGWDDPSEFTFLVRPSQGPLRRHLEADPEDRDLQRLASNVVMLLNQGPIGGSRSAPRDLNVRQTRESTMGAPLSRSEEPPAVQVPPPPPALGCFLAALGIGLGSLAGRLWLGRPAWPWNAVAVMDEMCPGPARAGVSWPRRRGRNPARSTGSGRETGTSMTTEPSAALRLLRRARS
jgi:hypothetical protein